MSGAAYLREETMKPIRFCLYQYPDRPMPILVERWKRAEALGFDVLWNADTLNEADHPGMTNFEAVATLAAMAVHTTRIRVGTLVTTLVYRNPAVVAKAAMTIDHLSEGRLELGFGGGLQRGPGSNHAASGIPMWELSERVARFAEAIRIVDGMLRSDVYTFKGEHYSVEEAEMSPRPIQQPRPPITIPAHGRRMQRVAAEFGDGWSSWGGYDVETEQQMYSLTRERSARFDEICVEAGRDPSSVRHSLVVFPPLIPWESVEYFRDMVGRFGEIGIDEFVLYWPQHWREASDEDRVFELVCSDLFPSLREF
jgi:alkanesulfonate monooxygenase SsuD/methylene tetrahydromethanopterin reductase-like flavin-dependent oxidoreductase (luciferase family)